MKTYCIQCGAPSNNSRCSKHAINKPAPQQRGYDWTWRKLSIRARRLQPFCTDCGTTKDLQADHKPEAWKRKARGQRIRLQDIDVVCGRCNRKRGAARGKHINR